MSWLFGGGGAASPHGIENAVHVLTGSGSYEEKKDALVTLRELVHDLPAPSEAVGRGIPAMVSMLNAAQVEEDVILVRCVLDILSNIVKRDGGEGEPGSENCYVQIMNAKMLVDDESRYISTVMDMLSYADFHVRYNILVLVRDLVRNGVKRQLQQALMADRGICKLMVLLQDAREVIRNEAILSISAVTSGDVELQKVIAFENAFELLLDICRLEGMADGSIVVVDALVLIQRLLEKNVSNQNYFREMSCIKPLASFFTISPSDMWMLTDKKKDIIIAALRVISLLVTGTNPSLAQNQQSMNQNGILTNVINLALSKLNSPEVRSQGLRTLGDLIKNHADNRNVFSTASVSVPTDIHGDHVTVPAIHRLVTVTLVSPHFSERIAGVHTFQCYLHDNPEAQIAIASTLTPQPDQEENQEQMSIGRQLLSGLSELNDPMKCWMSACVLGAMLNDNVDCKDYVLGISLFLPRPGADSVTLLSHAVSLLAEASQPSSGASVVVRAGLARLLCLWLHESETAVATFLDTGTNLSFLVDIVIRPVEDVHVQGMCALMIGILYLYTADEEHRKSLHSVIVHRVGVDKFIARLDDPRKSNSFILAEQDKIASVDVHKLEENQVVDYVLYDYELVTFFKTVYDSIIREVRSPKPRLERRAENGTDGAAANREEIEKYERAMNRLTMENLSLRDQVELLQGEVEEMKKSTAGAGAVPGSDTGAQVKELQDALHKKEDDFLSLSTSYNQLERLANDRADQLAALKAKASQNGSSSSAGGAEAEQVRRLSTQLSELQEKCAQHEARQRELTAEAAAARKERDEAVAARAQQELEVQSLKQRLESHPSPSPEGSASKEVEQLRRKLREAELEKEMAMKDQDDALMMLADEELQKTRALEEVSVLKEELLRLRSTK